MTHDKVNPIAGMSTRGNTSTILLTLCHHDAAAKGGRLDDGGAYLQRPVP
jgi:hypothetical protein